MNLLNRIVTVLALLSLIACAALTAIGVYLPPSLRDRAATAISAFLTLPETMALGQRLAVFAVATLVVLVAFMLLVLELRPGGEEESVQVSNRDGTTTRVARSAIHQRVSYAVDRLDDVVDVETSVRGGDRGLLIHLAVTTSPFIDVPMKSEEIREVTRQVIEKEMGLLLKKLTVQVDHKAYQGLDGTEEVV